MTGWVSLLELDDVRRWSPVRDNPGDDEVEDGLTGM